MRPLSMMVLCVSLAGPYGLAGERTEWTYALKAPGHSPTLYPHARQASGLIATAGRDVILLDGRGRVVWMASQEADTSTPATIADVNGDGKPEVLVALSGGNIVCLDHEGKQVWKFDHDGPVGDFEIITAADVLPEDGLEILIGYQDGWIFCLNAKGMLRWQFYGDRFRTGPVAVGDVDGDGAPEIVYGTDNGHVYCLTGWGLVKWRYFEWAPYGRSGPNLADLDGDGRVEVLITRSNSGNATCLISLDGATGRFKWRTKDLMQSYVSNACVDLDGDGRLEVIHADKGNHVYCTNHAGTPRWRADLAGRGIFWASAVADVDGDGAMEVVAGVRGVDPETRDDAYVVGADGTVRARLKLGGGANGGPAIADIDGDGKLEVIFCTQGPDAIQCVTWDGAGRVAWPSLRGNSAATAAANASPGTPVEFQPGPDLGVVRIESGDVVWGQNVWSVGWQMPAPKDAFIELSTLSASGVRRTWVTDVQAGGRQARVEWQGTSAGKTTASVRLLGAEGRACFVGRKILEPKPAEFCDYERVRQTCEDAVREANAAGADSVGITTRLVSLKVGAENVRGLVNSGASPERIADAATRLRSQADSLRSAATALGEFWRTGGRGDFVVWQDLNPWDRFNPLAVPDRVGMSGPIHVAAYGDEFEDVALTLLNISGSAIDVRCSFAKPSPGDARPPSPPPAAGHITLRRALRTPSHMGGMRNDALPRLDRSGVITLAPGEARQLWLVVDTHGLAAGRHDVTLYLGTLSERPTFREVPIRIDVWPVRLPKVYAQMNWAHITPGTVPDEMLRDMLDHGVSVFYGPSATLQVDAQGNQAAAVDWRQFDAALARLPGYAQVLFTGPPVRKWPSNAAPAPNGPQDVAGFKTAVRVLAEHMASIGWRYDRWAFYPVDEPWLTGGTQLPYLRRFCEMVKAADPKARNYTDPAGFVRVDGVAKFADLIDVWQPEMNLLKRDPALLAWFRKNARTFWSYEAPGPSKDLGPLRHYRAFAWLAWMLDAQGAGYWVYRDAELWWPAKNVTYGAVYRADDEVVPSRRWEASRDGVEDYRALYVLARQIEQARKAGRTSEADRAQALIDKAVADLVGEQARTIDEITRMTRDYALDYDLLCRYRVKIAEETIRLRRDRGFAE